MSELKQIQPGTASAALKRDKLNTQQKKKRSKPKKQNQQQPDEKNNVDEYI